MGLSLPFSHILCGESSSPILSPFSSQRGLKQSTHLPQEASKNKGHYAEAQQSSVHFAVREFAR